MNFLKKNKGFTLVEVLIVIAIVGIISVTVLNEMTTFVDSVRIKADEYTAIAIIRNVQYLVLAGDVKNETDYVDGIDYPLSQTNNSIMSASIKYDSSKCVVTVTDKSGFNYSKEIIGEAIK